MAAPQLSFRETTAGADNEKTIGNFNLRTEDLLTDCGITTVTDKEIQARNVARIRQNPKRATSWSTRVLRWIQCKVRAILAKIIY